MKVKIKEKKLLKGDCVCSDVQPFPPTIKNKSESK